MRANQGALRNRVENEDFEFLRSFQARGRRRQTLNALRRRWNVEPGLNRPFRCQARATQGPCDPAFPGEPPTDNLELRATGPDGRFRWAADGVRADFAGTSHELTPGRWPHSNRAPLRCACTITSALEAACLPDKAGWIRTKIKSLAIKRQASDQHLQLIHERGGDPPKGNL